MFDHDFENYPELTNAQLEVLRFLSPHAQIEEDFIAVVERVHDGDTITIVTPTRDFSFPLRLLDIDAPELNAGGAVSGDWLRDRVLGKTVNVLIDAADRVDKYGRLLGRVLVDGLNVGEEMLHLGLAVPFGLKNEGGIPEQAVFFRLNQWF
jgi:endonuclease YncB( thermonuclease family)